MTESEWATSGNAKGQEILHYLIGTSYLMRADLAEQEGDAAERAILLGNAREAFERGLALNKGSARIRNGLGIASYELLPSNSDCTPQDEAALRQIEEHFTSALTFTGESGRLAAYVQIPAHMYLARIELRRSLCMNAASQAALDHYLAVVRLFPAAEQSVFQPWVGRRTAKSACCCSTPKCITNTRTWK